MPKSPVFGLNVKILVKYLDVLLNYKYFQLTRYYSINVSTQMRIGYKTACTFIYKKYANSLTNTPLVKYIGNNIYNDSEIGQINFCEI